METRLLSIARSVVISPDRPVVLIGERINPTGKKRLAAALKAGDLSPVQREALEQVRAGADILDVNVGAAGVDEAQLLPRAVEAVLEVVDVPLCIDSSSPQALSSALERLRKIAPEARPILNSVNGEERSLRQVLPLVREYGTAVIALAMDERGIPSTPEGRLAVLERIFERAAGEEIPPHDVIADPLALAVGSDSRAALVTLQTIKLVREKLGCNITVGASNVSFGLPEREVINGAFLAMAIAFGVNCPIVDVARVRPIVLATELLLGRDPFAARYIKAYRERASR